MRSRSSTSRLKRSEPKRPSAVGAQGHEALKRVVAGSLPVDVAQVPESLDHGSVMLARESFGEFFKSGAIVQCFETDGCFPLLFQGFQGRAGVAAADCLGQAPDAAVRIESPIVFEVGRRNA